MSWFGTRGACGGATENGRSNVQIKIVWLYGTVANAWHSSLLRRTGEPHVFPRDMTRKAPSYRYESDQSNPSYLASRSRWVSTSSCTFSFTQILQGDCSSAALESPLAYRGALAAVIGVRMMRTLFS